MLSISKMTHLMILLQTIHLFLSCFMLLVSIIFFLNFYLPGLVGTRKSKSPTCLFSVSCYHFVINWFLLKKKRSNSEWKGNIHKCCVRPTKARSWNNSYGQFHEQPFMYWFLAFQGVVTAKLWSLNTQMQPKQWRRRRYIQFKYLTECNKFYFKWVSLVCWRLTGNNDFRFLVW